MTIEELGMFSSQPQYEPSRRSRVVEYTVTRLIGWIPHPIGSFLRQHLYRLFMGKFGNSIYIQAGCEFLGAKSFEIGHGVRIIRDVRLIATLPNSKICVGDQCTIDRGVDVRDTGYANCHIEIGDNTYIGPYTCIHGPGHIKIGDNCMIASHSGIYANMHIFSDLTRPMTDQGVTYRGIVIEDDCWLGTGVKVLDGVRIGRGSVIGAGAVVTKDIPPYSIAVGVPAKVISNRQEASSKL